MNKALFGLMNSVNFHSYTYENMLKPWILLYLELKSYGYNYGIVYLLALEQATRKLEVLVLKFQACSEFLFFVKLKILGLKLDKLIMKLKPKLENCIILEFHKCSNSKILKLDETQIQWNVSSFKIHTSFYKNI